MSENRKVRAGVAMAFVIVVLVAATGSYMVTDEFLTPVFFAYFVGNVIPPTTILCPVLLYPQSFLTMVRTRRRRPEQRWNAAGVLVVGLVLGASLVLVLAYGA